MHGGDAGMNECPWLFQSYSRDYDHSEVEPSSGNGEETKIAISRTYLVCGWRSLMKDVKVLDYVVI